MIRGTTPTHTFGIPVSSAEVKNIRVTYRQGGENVLEKKMEDVYFEKKEVKVDLTQEDTFKFKAGVNALIQIRVLTTDGKLLANKKPIITDVDESFNEEVLV